MSFFEKLPSTSSAALVGFALTCGGVAIGCGGGGGGGSDNTGGRYERPDKAEEIFTDSELGTFEDNGLPVNGGNSPPDIEGTYLFEAQEVVHTTSENYPASGGWCHDLMTFEATSDPQVYDGSKESTNCDSSSVGNAHYISGNGDCFTLYQETTGSRQNCDIERSKLLSACLTEGGDLDDPHQAWITRSREGPDCAQFVEDGRQLAEGELTINREADGVAERQQQ